MVDPHILLGWWSNLFTAVWAAALWRACWQGGLALLLVWIVCRAWPAVPPQLRVWLWRLAYLKLLLAWLWTGAITLNVLPSLPRLPLHAVQPPAPAVADQPAPAVSPTISTEKPATISSTEPAPTIATSQPAASSASIQPTARRWQWSNLLLFLGVLWLLGVVWGIIRLLLSMRLVHRLRHEGHPVSDETLLRLRVQMVKQMGLRKAPMLLAHPSEGPLLLGMVHPVIIVPEAMLSGSEEELQLALAHELAHVRRRDIFWGWLPVLVELLFFFHPLVYLARREYRLAQEIATDAQALERTGAAPKTYGAMLLNGAAVQAGYRPVPVAVGIMESYLILHRRLSAMKHLSASPSQYALAGILVFLLALAVMVPWRLAAQEGTATPGPHVPQLIPQVLGRASDYKLSVSPDNRYLMAIGGYGNASFCDMQSGRIDRSPALINIGDAAVSADSRYVLFNVISSPILWDRQDGQIVARWPDAVSSLYPVSGGKLVWARDIDKNGLPGKAYRLRELQTGKIIRTLDDITGDPRAISPNGSKALTTTAEMQGDQQPDSVCIIWDMTTGKEITRLRGVADLAQFNLDGSILAIINGNTIELYNTRTGVKIRSLIPADPALKNTLGSLAISPDGMRVAASHTGWNVNCFIIWDMATGRQLATLRNELHARTWVDSLVFSADGQSLCFSAKHEFGQGPAAKMSDAGVFCLDIATNTLRWSQEGSLTENRSRFAVLSEDNTQLAVSDMSSFALWDLTRGCLAREIILPADMHPDFDGFLFTPDGTQLIASAYPERRRDPNVPHSGPEPPREPAHLLVWNTATGTLLHDIPLTGLLHNQIAVSPDGKRAATCCLSARALTVWNTADWSVMKQFDLPDSPIVGAEFSPDGQWLAWTAAVRDATSKYPIKILYSTVSLMNLASGKITEYRTEGTYAHTVFFSPDSRQLVISISRGEQGGLTFGVFDVATCRLTVELEQPAILKQEQRPYSLHIYYDQPAGVIGCLFANPYDLSDGNLVTWDAGSGKIKRSEPRDARYTYARLLNTDPTIQVKTTYPYLNFEGVTLAPLSQLLHERHPQTFATLRRFDGGKWLLTTADGHYDCSPDLTTDLAWTFDGVLYPYQQYEKQYHRPDMVRKALAR